MSRKQTDFSKSVVYKIVCKDPNISDFYIGSTSNMSVRKNQHKQGCINIKTKVYNYPLYKYIREKGGWYNWKIITIEKYPCNERNQLLKRERYWYEIENPTLNTLCPQRDKGETDKIKYQRNKEEIKKRSKLWTINNAERAKQTRKEYRIKNKEKLQEKGGEIIICECGIPFTRQHKSRHIRTDNHQRWLGNPIEKTECGCGSYYTNDNKAQHLKTKKHKDYVNQLLI